MTRRMLPLLGLLVMAFAVTVRAEPVKKADSLDKKSASVKERSLLEQRLLAKRFADFKAALLRVKQRLEKSGLQEDKDKAQALDNALKQIDEAHLDTQFGEMIKILNDTKLTTIGDAQKAMERSKKLAEELAKLISILREDNRAAKLRDERKRLEEMIRELEGIIKDSKIVRAKTSMERMDKADVVGGQKNINDRTADLNRKLGGKDAKGKKGEGKAGKDTKGDAKGKGKGEGKEGEGKGKGKGKGEDKGDKNGKGKGKEGAAKKGDKNGKGEGKEGAAKKGDKNGKGEGKEGAAKKGDKNGKGEASKSKGKGKGEGESKSKGKGSQGEGKGEGKKGSESKSGSKSGKQGDQGDQGDQADKKDNPNPNQPSDDTSHARKQIQDAQENQKAAIKKLEEDKKKIAAKEQDKAIEKLEAAKKKLEELLRQAREEELERLLTALENRCRQMLEMQRQVKIGTVEIHKAILANKDKKPSRTNDQDSGRLADKEKEIILEATKAIEMIEAEGSAVAFAEVFKQVRTDMEDVQKRLEKTNVKLQTQEIEQDIIDTLEEMIKALQKAKQQLQPPPPSNGKPPPPPLPQDQKLLDMIAELKMIRSMQIKVNKRTKLYGDEYVAKEGEQTTDTTLKSKLKDLSDRQQKLFDVTMKIVKEENK